MREVKFHRFLDEENAGRIKFVLERGKVQKFVVQLECRFVEAGVFNPVVRYDTAHGFAHCDRLHPYEKATKSKLPTRDYNEALTFAMDDVIKNWHMYRRRFQEWLKKM